MKLKKRRALKPDLVRAPPSATWHPASTAGWWKNEYDDAVTNARTRAIEARVGGFAAKYRGRRVLCEADIFPGQHVRLLGPDDECSAFIGRLRARQVRERASGAAPRLVTHLRGFRCAMKHASRAFDDQVTYVALVDEDDDYAEEPGASRWDSAFTIGNGATLAEHGAYALRDGSVRTRRPVEEWDEEDDTHSTARN